MPLGSRGFSFSEDFLFANTQCLWLQFTFSGLITMKTKDRIPFRSFGFLPGLFSGIDVIINCDGVQELIRIEKGSDGSHFHSNGLFRDGIFL